MLTILFLELTKLALHLITIGIMIVLFRFVVAIYNFWQ